MSTRRPGGTARTAALIAVLPLFAGSFQYVVDLPPAYGLSKIWPILTAPLAVLAMLRLRPSYQPLALAALAWLMVFAGLMGIAQLGNDAVGAVASTVKIWPLAGALALPGLLWLMQPSAREIATAIGVLAAATFVFLIGAAALAPDALFEQGIEQTKVFLADPERGRRINAPIMFAVFGLFLLNRSFWRDRRWWKAVLILIGLIVMVAIYKQRAQIAGTVVCLGLGAALSLRRWRAPVLAFAAAGAIGGAIPAWLWLQARVTESLGGSLTMRQHEAEAAVAFLNAEPWRWITGVGSATRVGGVTLGDIVGLEFFFLSDLGWLGVVFEYGVVGAGLILALHCVAIRMACSAAASAGALGRALFDYALFLLVVSPIVSVALSPGELAVCLALAWRLQNTSGPAMCSTTVRRMIRRSS